MGERTKKEEGGEADTLRERKGEKQDGEGRQEGLKSVWGLEHMPSVEAG